MLREICLVLGAGLLLAACSGSSGSGNNPGDTTPDTCDGKCGADEVCSDGACFAACSSDKSCKDGEACRDGGCQKIVCGDAVVEGDEECDNGDRNRDDAACTSSCHKATCGDGLIRAGREDCDNGADNSDDADCTSDCHEATCGDGLVWKGHEDCDAGADNDDTGACTSACVDARCGDGLVWAGHEACDDGNEMLDDKCPDGPKGTCQWNMAPDPATGLGWQQGAATNTKTLVATWTPSPSPMLMGQKLQLFSDESCMTALGKPVVLAATSTASQQLSVAGEGTYSFQIITTDSESRDSKSACSPAIVVDTTPPEAATNLAFVEASPHDTLTVHGTWTRSKSPDLAAQAIQLFGGGVCAIATGDPVDVGSATAEASAIVTPTGATFSYKVISSDLAGNTAVSGCSPAMLTSGGVPTIAKFNGDFAQYVIQTRIDPKSASTIYVTLSSGEIHKSVNSGATWTLQCTSSNIAQYGTNYGHIYVSPDGTAYAAGHTTFARVEALAGAECPTAIDGSAAWASYYHSNRLAIDSTGKLYTWGFVTPAGLVSSINKGATYTNLNTTGSLFNSLEIDPFDDNHLIGVFGSHNPDPVGIWNSTDAGVKWTQIDSVFQDYQSGVRFNPAAKGWIYMGGGHYSQNGGTAWNTDPLFDCGEIDSSGAGYRLATSGMDTLLQRASDMTNPSWSTLHTFTGVVANLSLSMVSVVGGTIAVALEGRLFISTNSGMTFNPLKFALKNATLNASSIVARGQVLYAAANGRIFKSSDAAKNWAEVYAPADPLDADTELHLNPGVTDQLLARPESWNSTYQNRVDVTLDGGGSWTTSSDCCYSWAGVVALGPADASRIYYFGWEPRYSTNGGLSFMESSSSGQLVWYPWPAAFVKPGDNNLAWYGDDSGRLSEYNLGSKSSTDVSSRVPFKDLAGIDMIKLGATWQVRVISRTGEVATSDDNGATFTLVPGSGGLPSADRRIFVSHPDSPKLIATAPLLGGTVAYSPTLGASWVQNTLNNCTIRSLALTDGQLMMACDGKAVMTIAAP